MGRIGVISSLLALFLCIAQAGIAQKIARGTVKDEKGVPVVAATIEVQGTNIRELTGTDGSFTITVPNDRTSIIITSVGYEAREIPVGQGGNFEIVMRQTTSNLNEVVVVGYGTQRRGDLSGSIAVVDIKEMKKQPASNAAEQLQGQASGVTVIGSGSPGQAPRVTIRGVNSFGNNNPLYIVDGVPTQNIAFINPSDISSMSVLKDAGAASIYGSRASNGIIIVTTKKGSGKVKVTYDGTTGVQMPLSGNVWNTLNPQEMAELKWMALKNTADRTGIPFTPNDALYGQGASPVLPDYLFPTGAKEGSPEVDPSRYFVIPEYTSVADYNKFYRITKANKSGTNWFDEITDPAPYNNHGINVTSGNENGNFLFGVNYLNNQGTVNYTYMKRYSLRMNSQYNITPRLRVGENLMYSLTDNPRIGLQEEGNWIGYAYRMQPIIPVYDIMGNFGGTYGGQVGNAWNSVALQYRSRNNRGLTDNLFGNVFAEVDILRDLTFRTTFGGERYSYEGNSFSYPSYENAEDNKNNGYNLWAGSGYNWTWSNILTYTKVFDKHNLKLMAGTEAYESNWRENGGRTEGYFSFNPNFTTLSTGSANPTNYSSKGFDALNSYFGRVDYSFAGKYILSGTVRHDGTSKLLTYRWGTFPAFSAAWRISEESFMENTNLFQDLKIRGSWGIRGNVFNVSGDNAYATFVAARNSTYYDISGTSNSSVEGFRQGRIANPDAKWENDIDWNIGFDATLRGGVFSISADYFQKNIKDLLFTPTYPGTVGQATPPAVNIGSMSNKGVDIQFNARPQITNDFRLDISGTFTTYKNEIIKIAPPQTYFTTGGTRTGDVVRNMVGYPVSTFYGYKIVGFWNSQAEIDAANEQARKVTGNATAVYQNEAAVGRFRYDDKGAGIVTPDSRQIIGDPNPDFTYGLNLGFTYKNFDFSTFFYGVAGADIYNQVKWWTDFYPSFNGGKSKTALYDSWTPTNQNAKVAIQENSSSFSSGNVVNSYFVEDGSYLRNKNMTLGYTIPSSVFGQRIERFRVYVQATNLFTITNYSGLDPELYGSPINFGRDEGMYPNPKQYLFGVNVTF